MAAYEFSMRISVSDPEALYRAACARWEQDNNGAGRDDILRPDGEIDEARCIQMLADPGASWDGTEIEDSICESY